MDYPDKQLVIETLVEVARLAGNETNADHPEDIAIAMMNAVEASAVTICVLHRKVKLTR